MRNFRLVLATCDLFVLLAMDDGMLRKAIMAHYKGDVAANDPLFADNYLRKIVQISLFLPATQADARVEMVSQFFSDDTRSAWRNKTGGDSGRPDGDESDERQEKGTGLEGLEYDLGTVLAARRVEAVADTVDELEAMHDCREYLPDNARELKRLVNTHRFVKILLSSGGDAWPVDRQRALVKWLVFCANWPDLVDDVLSAAAKEPPPDDCLAELSLPDAARQARLAKFIALRPPISALDLCGDFAVAARLSQVVYDSIHENGASLS